MRPKIKIVFSFFLFSFYIGFSQTTFQKWYYGEGVGYGVQQTFDGGYIILGTVNFDDLYLLKTNAIGDSIWSKTFGGPWGYGYSVQQTKDSGYVICSSFNSASTQYDAYLVKTDTNGDTLWTKKFGGSNNDKGYSVQQTLDGGYIIACQTESYGQSSAGNPNAYVIKTNSNGNLQWDATFGGTQLSGGYSAQQTNDGGYIMAGGIVSVPPYGDLYLLKMDSDGNTLWDTTYGGSGSDVALYVKQTTDNGYIIAGVTHSFGAGNSDVYLVKTDSAGILQWYKTFGGVNNDYGYSVQQTNDGGFIILGTTYSYNIGAPWNMYMIKTDSAGNHQWSRVFGAGSGWCDGASVCLTSDGGFAAVGDIEIFGGPSVYLVKTDSMGNPGLTVYTSDESPGFQNAAADVFPNPFSSCATFRISENIFFSPEKYCLEIYNLYGQKVQETYLTEKQTAIYRNNLSDGIYFYLLKKENYFVASGKFVVSD